MSSTPTPAGSNWLVYQCDNNAVLSLLTNVDRPTAESVLRARADATPGKVLLLCPVGAAVASCTAAKADAVITELG